METKERCRWYILQYDIEVVDGDKILCHCFANTSKETREWLKTHKTEIIAEIHAIEAEKAEYAEKLEAVKMQYATELAELKAQTNSKFAEQAARKIAKGHGAYAVICNARIDYANWYDSTL